MGKLKRYIVFLIGLFINSLGVSLITKADLGTSPISSIPYVLSLNFPFTLGQFTIAFSLLLILIQLIILRRNFKAEHLLQIPVSILFGYFIDLTMVMLFFVDPQSYISSVIYLLVGCLILGFGVYTEVLANVAMLPGESFVRAVSSTWKTEFGTTKVAFDVSLTVIAARWSSHTAWTASERERSSPHFWSVSLPDCSGENSLFSMHCSSIQMKDSSPQRFLLLTIPVPLLSPSL